MHFLAMAGDETALLNYLNEPDEVSLHPWPIVDAALSPISRADLGARQQIMVVRRELGPPRVVRPGDAAFSQPPRAALFNRLNWERLHPTAAEHVVDSNSSPVLLWQRGAMNEAVIRGSEIGSQADSMAAVSRPYESWVNRIMGWVRRRGTRVWGLERHAVRPDLDIDLQHVSSVYALPDALAVLESGAPAR